MGGESGDLFDDGDDGEERAFPASVRRSGPGRPAGAVNKKTLALKQYYAAKGFRDPIGYLGEILSSDPVELWRWMVEQSLPFAAKDKNGRHLGLPTLTDVIALQVKAAAELAPYLHGKAPIRIETDDKALPVLIMDLGTDQVTAGRLARAADAAMSIGFAETEENQGVGDGEGEASHD